MMDWRNTVGVIGVTLLGLLVSGCFPPSSHNQHSIDRSLSPGRLNGFCCRVACQSTAPSSGVLEKADLFTVTEQYADRDWWIEIIDLSLEFIEHEEESEAYYETLEGVEYEGRGIAAPEARAALLSMRDQILQVGNSVPNEILVAISADCTVLRESGYLPSQDEDAGSWRYDPGTASMVRGPTCEPCEAAP